MMAMGRYVCGHCCTCSPCFTTQPFDHLTFAACHISPQPSTSQLYPTTTQRDRQTPASPQPYHPLNRSAQMSRRVSFADVDDVSSVDKSDYAPSVSSDQTFESAHTSPSSVDSIQSNHTSKSSSPPSGASISANDRCPILTSTFQDFHSNLQRIPPVYSTRSTKASLFDSWISGIPDNATKEGTNTPKSFATGLQRLDRQYAASSVNSDVDAWSDAISSVGDDETDSDSDRSVVGDNDKSSWDQKGPYQGGFIGSRADCWSGKNVLDTDGTPITPSYRYSTATGSFVPWDGGYVEDDSEESTIEDYHQIVKSGYRTRDDSRPPRSSVARSGASGRSSAMSNLPDWKNYASVTDVPSSPRTVKSTVQPKSILKNRSSRAPSVVASSPRSSSVSKSQNTFTSARPLSRSQLEPQSQIEEWQIRSDMKSFENDISYWHSKADLAESQGDLETAKTCTGIGNAHARKWRGANRQLEEMTGKSVTAYDYISELSCADITAGSIAADEFMLDLERDNASWWSNDASRYTAQGNGRMVDYCQSQSRASTWKADEMERELNVKKALLSSRQGTSYGRRTGYSTYMPGPQGFVY